ncbi:origin of replication complex subunit 6 [Selaginella moellendorffii]|uniref:origin of replication complex subunit 6 n=1 Tax=Selaginella moellendorffii TaxID=88036 RepID=UPI000D1D123A|nr:origin of replication complex subunit 6 [Selaginella moellendorffii]|eukprot:XP_024520633.1 origin of replication complex subunit 6 [Selaginella moellendorffii]
MEVSSTSDPEFSNVAASMTDICFDLVGVEKEKSESRTRECKRALSDATNLEDPGRTTCLEYEEWKEPFCHPRNKIHHLGLSETESKRA